MSPGQRPHVKAKASDPKRLEALLGIAKLVAPKARSIAAQVTQAFREPAAYIAAHAAAMEERGIEKPVADLPWIALIDALESANALTEIDWKTDAEDVTSDLSGLHRGFKLPRSEDPDDDDRSTWELLEIAGRMLREKGVQLAQLDMGSDAFPLVVVPAAKFPELARLAARARYGEAQAFGDDLAAAAKDRVAREKKHARELAQRAATPQPQWTTYQRGRETWSLKAAELGVDIGYETKGIKRFEFHTFSTSRECKAFAKQRVAEWRAQGFVALTEAQVRALPTQGTGACLGWVGPFPEDARYYREGSAVIRCVMTRGDAVVVSGGAVGKNFGELENHHHGPRGKEIAASYEQNPKFYKPIDRAAVIALYASSRRAPARRPT